MPISAIFGVKSEDFEQAKVWVENATGLTAVPRENSSLGGDYYSFESSGGLEITLVKNRDLHDDEPVVGAPAQWSLVLTVEEPDDASEAIDVLGKLDRQFQQIKLERWQHE